MMANLTIKTNRVPRDIIRGFDLSPTERAEFDYIDDIDSASFFKYKNQVYDLGEFMPVSDVMWNCHGFKDWQGYHSDSFFSGILIRYVDDFERVIVASYYS